MKIKFRKLAGRLAAFLLALAVAASACGCELSEVYGGIFASSGSYSGEPDGQLILRFLYVGQADCTLISLPTGETLLVDGGNDGDGDNIAGYIEDLGIERLDYVVNTHPHEDHLGGLDKILNRIDTGHIYTPDLPSSAKPDSRNYKDFIEAAESKDCGIDYLSAGERLYQGGGVTIDCLSPDSRDVFSKLNDYSIVLMISYGEDSFLLMGDAEETAEEIILRSGADVEADLIKVGHHGSSTSSSVRFVNAVDPDYAVISCGIDNSYGFPHSETLKTYDAVGSKVYVTADCGSVMAVSKGDGITVTADKSVYLDSK